MDGKKRKMIEQPDVVAEEEGSRRHRRMGGAFRDRGAEASAVPRPEISPLEESGYDVDGLDDALLASS